MIPQHCDGMLAVENFPFAPDNQYRGHRWPDDAGSQGNSCNDTYSFSPNIPVSPPVAPFTNMI